MESWRVLSFISMKDCRIRVGGVGEKLFSGKNDYCWVVI